MMRAAMVFAVLLLGCESTETLPRESLDATPDASDAAIDTSTDAPADTAHCCPIGERGCCMLFGGARANNPSCGMVCDNLPDDLVQAIDDAGCPYWRDPPGGGITCRVGLPPPDGGDDG